MFTPARVAMLVLAVSACAATEQQYPLPLAVGETHNDVQALKTTAAVETPLAEISVPGSAGPSSVTEIAKLESPPAAASCRVETIGDPEIFAILFAVHQREIARATVAQKQAADPGLRAFASTVIADHTAALNRTIGIARALDVQSWDTRTSRRMREETPQDVARLAALRGADFDKHFIDEIMAEHAYTVAVIDSKLLPSVGSLELKAELEGDKAAAWRHVAAVQEIQRRLER